jgi:DnaK suppressor protein
MHPRTLVQISPGRRYRREVKILLSTKKLQQFKKTLAQRISESERVLANAEQETRANSARHADPGDQAAAENERQTLSPTAAVARPTRTSLTDALTRINPGNFGECAQCGAEIEVKRLEAVPWARYCLKCQEAREQR